MKSRIVFVTNDETYGGPNKVCERVFNLLKESQPTELIVQGEGNPGFKDLSKTQYRQFTRANFKFITQFIKEERKYFDHSIYIAFGTKQSLLLCFLKIVLGKKIKLIVRTGLNKEGSNRKKGNFFKDYVQLHICKVLYNLSDSLVTETKSMQEWWVSEGVDQQKVTHINNPVKKLEINNEGLSFYNKVTKGFTKVIVSVGRLSYQKDHELLILSFNDYLTKKRDSNDLLIILGEGDELNRLKKITSDLGISNKVLFLGYVSNVRPFLEMSDLYCLTSRWEGGVNSLIEAVYYGSKILSIDCPVGPKDILNGISGARLVPNRSPVEFSNAMFDILNDEATSEVKRKINTYSDAYIRAEYHRVISEAKK
ncbi:MULTISPECIES: glycosyltransferase [Vibrio]|uniref:glycosyltransferase n=1 Tax=Vibrio TaxID=662 RepID=UPI00187E77DB|nr:MULTISPECIES: glycosyltransferase [Vibrio]MBE8557267.1 glycosyltransferase [Vibrio sp. OPT24]MCQ8869372.1 glycosyltransferase [Vibrio splendidus]